jgi:uncharacterized protein (DUF58 family)
VALTGRTAALALAGARIVLAFRSVTGLILVEGLLAAGIVVDLLLAAPVRKLRLTRSGDTKVRLGETAVVTLTIANSSGRPLRAQLRDAWPPSAGAAPRTAPVALAGGGSAQVRTALTPSRRGDAVAATVTIRSSGPLGLAARQASRPVPWRVRALPPFRSRRHLPEKLARLRETTASTARCGAGRAASSTHCASTWSATTCAPSTGGARRGTPRCWCGPGARSVTAASWCCWTPGGRWPGGSGTRRG